MLPWPHLVGNFAKKLISSNPCRNLECKAPTQVKETEKSEKNFYLKSFFNYHDFMVTIKIFCRSTYGYMFKLNENSQLPL